MPETITVLLTALSTFPWDAEKKDYKALVRNKYYYKDKNETDIEVEGIYQLDPLVNLLVKQEKKLDKVILLATRQTKEAVELVADDYMEDQVISPVDYFKRHLQVSMKEDLSEENCHTIEIDENQPSAAIKQVASDIQEWGMSNTIELYVDTHGGFRSNALIMEAIVDLIAEDRIQAHFYNVQFGQGKNRILEDESAKIFDFVSGIREFTNYGRIDSLEHFEDKDSCATLLAPIREISNGIQWCNLSFFELGLRHLNNYFKKGKNPISNDYLQIFENKIELDYKTLLNDDNEFDAANAIAWCMKKGFFQQAITIAEAKTADYLKSKDVFSLTPDGNNLKEKYSLSWIDIWNGCIYKYHAKIDWWDSNDTNDHMHDRRKFKDIFGHEEMNFSDISKKIEELFMTKAKGRYKSNETIRWDESVKSAQQCDIKSDHQPYINPDDIEDKEILNFKALEESTDARNGRIRSLGLFLFMHKTIKDIRNRINHVDSDNPYPLNAIKRAVDYYLWLIQEIK